LINNFILNIYMCYEFSIIFKVNILFPKNIYKQQHSNGANLL